MRQAVLLDPLVRKAAEYAKKHHQGQTRKHTGEDYYSHCCAVALIVSLVTDDPEVVAAAYVHDLCEDTSITLADLEKEFGPRVAMIVGALTKKKWDAATPVCEQDRHVINQLKAASADAATIKLADITHNLRTLPAEGKIDYMLEKAGQVAVLQHGDPVLVQMANRTVVHALADALGAAA
ncbi:HD domain-containing protein [bacterium]|nr:HD domain-containing protein [bacterium]